MWNVANVCDQEQDGCGQLLFLWECQVQQQQKTTGGARLHSLHSVACN
jgi:hypothetical protein